MIYQEGGRWKSEPTPEEREEDLDDIIEKLDPEELAALQKIIGEFDPDAGGSEIANTCAEMEWEEVPLPIEEWLDSHYHVGDTGETIFPVLKKDIIELFSNDHHEVILCLHPDTRIPLVDGTTPTIKELSERWEDDQTPFWVYSYKHGELGPTKAIHPRQTGIDDYYRVTLDDGSTFTGNARHQMLRRSGTKVMIRDMTPGDSLMPFNVELSSKEDGDRIEGYEKIQLLSGEWEYTHRLVAKSLCEKEDGDEDTVHHEDFRKENNTPENLRWMRWKDHIQLHSESFGKWAKANPKRAVALYELRSRIMLAVWAGDKSDERRGGHSRRMRERNLRGNASKAGRVAWKNRSPEAKAAFRSLMVARNKSHKQRRAVSAARSNSNRPVRTSRPTSKGRHLKKCVTIEDIVSAWMKGASSAKKLCETLDVSASTLRRAFVEAGETLHEMFDYKRGNWHGRKRPDVTIDSIKETGAGSLLEASELLECSPSAIRRALVEGETSVIEFFGNRRGRRRGKDDLTINLVRSAIADGADSAKQVAQMLGRTKSTVYRFLKSVGLTWDDVRPKSMQKITLDQIHGAVGAGSTTRSAAAERLGCSENVIYWTLKKAGLTWKDVSHTVGAGNHYVVSIERTGSGPVYCMTVPEAGNFAISTATDIQSSSIHQDRGAKGANPTRRVGVVSSNTGSIPARMG